MGLAYCCLRLNSSEEIVPNQNRVIDAKVMRVVDGDTYDCQFYYGLKIMRMKVRVMGLDTPEKKGNELEKKASEVVSKYVKKYMERYSDMVKIRIKRWDKYGGRVVGEVWVNKVNVCQHLVEKKFGKEYDGGKKEVWTKEQLEKIINYNR